jgi:hypothetical protein
MDTFPELVHNPKCPLGPPLPNIGDGGGWDERYTQSVPLWSPQVEVNLHLTWFGAIVNRTRKGERCMPEYTDMRFNQRTGVKAAISYCHFSSTTEANCNGTVLNWSDCGLCFKAQRPLYPGQCIYIRTTIPGETGTGLRSVTLAQVRWCDESQAPSKIEYIIGASYL